MVDIQAERSRREGTRVVGEGGEEAGVGCEKVGGEGDRTEGGGAEDCYLGRLGGEELSSGSRRGGSCIVPVFAACERVLDGAVSSANGGFSGRSLFWVGMVNFGHFEVA